MLRRWRAEAFLRKLFFSVNEYKWYSDGFFRMRPLSTWYVGWGSGAISALALLFWVRSGQGMVVSAEATHSGCCPLAGGRIYTRQAATCLAFLCRFTSTRLYYLVVIFNQVV